MDLSRYDTREKAHEGVDVPLVIDGEPAISDVDGQPVTFRLRGRSDPDVQRVLLASGKKQNRTADEVLEADLKLARVAVVGWSDNVMIGDERVPFSRQAIDRVFAIPAVRVAVLAEVFRDDHFMNGA